MAKKPARPSRKAKATKDKAPLKPASPLSVKTGPDGKVIIGGDIPDTPLPAAAETVRRSKRAKAKRAGAHPPIPEAAASPETARSPEATPPETPTLGRPTEYTPEIADHIIESLANGLALVRICAEPGMPARGTVLGWVTDNREGFSDRYARAREAQAWGWADDINEIGDASGVESDNRSTLRCNNRKWLLSKLLPKQFGDRLDLNVKDQRTDTPDGRRARIAELMALGFVPAVPADAPGGV